MIEKRFHMPRPKRATSCLVSSTCKQELSEFTVSADHALFHSYDMGTIDGLRPDFVVRRVNVDNNCEPAMLCSANIVTVIELYTPDEDDSKKEEDETKQAEYFQRGVDYNRRLLESQPLRQFVISAIGTVNAFQFIRSNRKGQHLFTDLLPTGTGNTLELLMEMMRNDSVNGFVADSLGFEDLIELDKFIEERLEGRIFRVRGRDQACKIFKPGFEILYKHERKVLKDLQSRFPEQKRHLFSRVVASNDRSRALIVEPIGLAFDLNPSLETRLRYLPLKFQCLKALRSADYVHGGLTHWSFRHTESGGIFIIDSCSLLKTYSAVLQAEYSYAPVELLAIGGEPIFYSMLPWHNMVNLINMLSLELHGNDQVDGVSYFDKLANIDPGAFKELSDFWTDYYAAYPCCGYWEKRCRVTGRFDSVSFGFQEHYREVSMRQTKATV